MHILKNMIPYSRQKKQYFDSNAIKQFGICMTFNIYININANEMLFLDMFARGCVPPTYCKLLDFTFCNLCDTDLCNGYSYSGATRLSTVVVETFLLCVLLKHLI